MASGANKAAWSSISCSKPREPFLPRFAIGASEAITKIGEPEIDASPNAATVFAAPGPVVVNATAKFPVVLANPSAAYAAVCSWRTPIIFGRLAPSASQNARL